jgi:Domain of unknown function (DUF4032)/Lipopolysaccharide kinase (Kdo/WaaP) family
MRLHMVTRPGHPDFLDLSWDRPLEAWRSDRLVEVPRGISRHVVRFVAYGSALYGVKELRERLAHREYHLLRALANLSLPVVEVVGLVTGRASGEPGHPDLEAVLITRHLEYSLPYRLLFSSRGLSDARGSLLDALVQLLVRLHLKGFYWGDCSLSNTLFRRDAGGLAAYLVDAETGELHPELTEGQRAHDLAIAEENIAGDLMDIQASGVLPAEVDPLATAAEVGRRYEELWSELTRPEVFGLNERYRIDARLGRLNELGFDVDELELVGTPGGYRLSLQPRVVEPGHYRRRLMALVGMEVLENQARRLLNDIAGYRCHLECEEGSSIPEQVAAYRWLTEVFEPAIAAMPAVLRERLEPAEVFHQVLEHRWFLSEAAGRDVGMAEAVASYVGSVLPFTPEERAVIQGEPEEGR